LLKPDLSGSTRHFPMSSTTGSATFEVGSTTSTSRPSSLLAPNWPVHSSRNALTHPPEGVPQAMPPSHIRRGITSLSQSQPPRRNQSEATTVQPPQSPYNSLQARRFELGASSNESARLASGVPPPAVQSQALSQGYSAMPLLEVQAGPTTSRGFSDDGSLDTGRMISQTWDPNPVLSRQGGLMHTDSAAGLRGVDAQAPAAAGGGFMRTDSAAGLRGLVRQQPSEAVLQQQQSGLGRPLLRPQASEATQGSLPSIGSSNPSPSPQLAQPQPVVPRVASLEVPAPLSRGVISRQMSPAPGNLSPTSGPFSATFSR